MNKALITAKLFIKKNSATILTVGGAIGVVATAVTAAKATPKAMALLEKAKEEKGTELTVVETVKVAGPAYIPSVLIGASTIACIFGANVLNKRKQASLMSAYALLDNSYKEYKNKVKELYGEEADGNVRHEIAKDHVQDAVKPPGDKRLFFDMYSMQYFEASMADITAVESEINRTLQINGAVSLNYYLDLLNIPHDNQYSELGWSVGQMYDTYWTSWIDLYTEHTELDDGLELGIITIMQEPTPDYLDY